MRENTARVPDFNGWMEIKGNPISKVGVFDYLGAQISDELEPDKVYKVYRPEEELSDPDTIASFKLVPWIDDHEMLGAAEDDLTPAEKKGIQGYTGENVYFESPYLRANLKVVSEKLSSLIADGKKELSIGYRCLYDIVSGVHNGIRYDAIQRKIRGNHLALVDEGRSGPDVAVLDKRDAFRVTLDTKGLESMIEKTEEAAVKAEGAGQDELTLESLAAVVGELKATLEKLMGAEKTEAAVIGSDTEEEVAVGDAEEEEKAEDEAEVPSAKAMDAMIKKTVAKEVQNFKKTAMKTFAMDVAERNTFVDRVIPWTGAFDHAAMTVDEAAAYAVKKLDLPANTGNDRAVVEGYLAGRKSGNTAVGMDTAMIFSSDKNDRLNNYYKSEGK